MSSPYCYAKGRADGDDRRDEVGQYPAGERIVEADERALTNNGRRVGSLLVKTVNPNHVVVAALERTNGSKTCNLSTLLLIQNAVLTGVATSEPDLLRY